MDAATGWLVFLSLVVLLAGLGPVLRLLLRVGLARPRRASHVLPPVGFGGSTRARPSPRHATRLHRTLTSVVFVALLSLWLLPAVVGLRASGAVWLPSVFAFVLPALIVLTHARRRSPER